MNNLTLTLSDKSEVSLQGFTLPMHVVVVLETKEDVLALSNRLTPENLTEVQIKEGNDILLTYRNASLTGAQQMINDADGSITAHFYLSGERENVGNPEYKQALEILLGEAIE